MKALRILFGAYSGLLVATLVNAGMTSSAIRGVTVETADHTALQMTNANERNASFNANLQKAHIPGRITQCDSLIDVPVGTAHGNHSYGGVCTQLTNGKKMAVMICDDEMIGHFKVENLERKISTQELINFTIANCYGG